MMLLPENIRFCMERLGNAGFTAYAVGGCTRDSLLGLTPHDYDLCTSATPEQMHRIFSDFPLVTNGEKHGTVSVVMDKELVEITTYRVEGGYRDNRHPDFVRFVPDVKEDLARRDFTVNAIAYRPEEGYVDPFGGQADLDQKILRTVGDPETRFREDALRILRGVRFAVKYGLTPEKKTLSAMLALTPLLDHLARERVFDELCKLLPLVKWEDLTFYAPILTRVLPELAPSVGFQQHSPHHAYDVFVHTAHVVENVPDALPLRWAALLHDVGKPACYTEDETGRGHFYGHAEESARLAGEALRRLKAPNVLRERVVFLIAHHMTPLPPDKKILRRRLGKYGEEAVWQLLALQRADFGSKGTGVDEPENFENVASLLREILAEGACLTLKDLAISGSDLAAMGFAPGKAFGDCLTYLLSQVQDETLPNTREALLPEAKRVMKSGELKAES